MLNNLATVGEWNEKQALSAAFMGLTIFENIYLPVKTPTAQGMPDQYTYTNIGMDYTDLTEAYEALYGYNFITVPLLTDNLIQSSTRLKNKIKAVYNLNKYKYLKLIELQGYEYNPLYNVDGVENYTFISNQGTEDTTTTKAYTQYTDSNSNTNTKTGSVSDSGSSASTHEDTNSVTSFDSSTFNDTDHNTGNQNTTSATNTTTYNEVSDSSSGSITHGAHTDTDTTTITHHNALNGLIDYSGGTDLFGNSVTGGDHYHNERRERKGNIGVTKTQELIDSERNNLQFSIIMEFFKDINKIILAGIYEI